MTLLALIMKAVAVVLDLFISFFIFMLIARAVISWVNPDPYNPIVRFLVTTTEPLLAPLRRRIPTFSGIDLSPLVLLAIFYAVRIILVDGLRIYAAQLSPMVMQGGY